jgi:hypothetical protein
MVREFKARETLRRWLPGGVLIAVLLVVVILWWPQGGLTDYEEVGLAFYKDIWLNQDPEEAKRWLSKDTRITETNLRVGTWIAEGTKPKTIWLLENEETKERDDEKHLLIYSPETKRSHLLVLIREESDWKVKNGEITQLTKEEIDRHEPDLEWKEVSL